jgi:aminopeptidase N
VELLPSATGKPSAFLLTKKKDTLELPGCSEWVYGNAGARGYYRGSYDPQAFAKLSAGVETAFTPEERLRIPGDAWALVRVGRMKIGDYLELLGRMQAETSRDVIRVTISHIPEIHDHYVSAADRPAFEKWVRDFFKPMAQKLGDTAVAGEAPERQALRADLFSVLANYGRDPELIERARSAVAQYMRAPESVDASFAGRALTVAAMNGDSALYDQYVAHLKTAKSPEEYGFYLRSLGAFPDKALTRRTFDLILGPEVKSQDLMVLFYPLVNYETQLAAWSLFKSDFPSIMQKIGPADAPIFAEVAGVFCDAGLRDDSQKFFAEQRLPGTERILKNQMDEVNACIQVRDLQQKNLSAYLLKYR